MGNKYVLLLAVMLAAFHMANAQVNNAKEDNIKGGKEVFAVVAKWSEAVRSRDERELRNVFETDLVITAWDGKTRGKAEEIALLTAKSESTIVSIVNEEMKVRAFGDTALVTARTKMRTVANRKDAFTVFRFTAMLLKRDERWQIIALQTSRNEAPAIN